DGTILYYENTGTASAPVFTQQTGAANPFNSVTVDNFATPTFVDIDGDGDKDAFIGEYDGQILYYKNIGTASAPFFTQQLLAANPFNGVSVGTYSSPVFVDIDGDGDMDAFTGEYYGQILYYKNTGTASAPVFAAQTGASNPFNGLGVGYNSAPTFADLDGDGDMDALVGSYDGTIYYFKNTGTTSAPLFVLQTGGADPLNGVNVGSYSAPALVDIDNDGDADLFVGSYSSSTISYFENTSISLPLHLISFNGNRQADYNQLQWQTADEVNTKLFEIERSTDGRNFTKIASLNSAGSNNNYSIKDAVAYSGKVFYRLKIIDIDGRFTYSPVIWINSDRAAGISIYPNPVSDMININIGNAKILKTNAGIFDANGRLVQHIFINADQTQINAQLLAKGVYVIKFADGSAQSFIKK
ncbi:MAG: T9SS type A sorting domain-containing protein, partial [Ginsengibacter sp.]